MVKYYEKIDYSYKDLEKLRDSEGFIDLDKINLKLTDKSKELIGNTNRIKNWVKFKDTLCLIKGEIMLDNIRNYGVYAEVIIEQIGIALGVDMAHYDLVKINGKRGVLSVYMSDSCYEIVSLRDIIKDQDYNDSYFVDSTDYEYTIKRLEQELKDIYHKDVIDKLILEYKKRLAFYIMFLEADKHVENISFIKKDNDIYLSPNYDSEASLLLDNDINTIDKILEDYANLDKVADITSLRIGLIKPIEKGGFENVWMDTLEELIEDDLVYDYCNTILRKKIDMDNIFEIVEKRINAKLPDNLKLIAKYAYLSRYNKFIKILDGIY